MVPLDHLAYLQRRPFAFKCSTAIFPTDELDALAEYGNWLEALATEAIQAVTAEQKHFLEVARGQAAPTTICERAWVRLEARREYEQEEKIVPPAAAPPDYGIVEWDADRCWW